MSGAILTDTSIAVISTGITETAVVTAGNTITTEAGTPVVVVSGLMGPPGAVELSKFRDVDTTNLSDGGILVYTQSTQKWTATNTLERQVLEGGQF